MDLTSFLSSVRAHNASNFKTFYCAYIRLIFKTRQIRAFKLVWTHFDLPAMSMLVWIALTIVAIFAGEQPEEDRRELLNFVPLQSELEETLVVD